MNFSIVISDVINSFNVSFIQYDPVLFTERHILGYGDGAVPGDVRPVEHFAESCRCEHKE